MAHEVGEAIHEIHKLFTILFRVFKTSRSAYQFLGWRLWLKTKKTKQKPTRIFVKIKPIEPYYSMELYYGIRSIFY